MRYLSNGKYPTEGPSRPKSEVKLFSPYVGMAEPLAAYKEEPRKEVEEVEEE